jgi:hypothetical protein
MNLNSHTDFYDLVDEPIDETKIRWFLVKANLTETKQELDEKIVAIKEQIKRGIIHPNGLPVGIDLSLFGAPVRKPVQTNNQSQIRNNSNLGYLNRPQAKLSPQELFNQRFGLKK